MFVVVLVLSYVVVSVLSLVRAVVVFGKDSALFLRSASIVGSGRGCVNESEVER